MSKVVGIFPNVLHESPMIDTSCLACCLSSDCISVNIAGFTGCVLPRYDALHGIQGAVKTVKISSSRSSEYTCTENKNFECKLTTLPVDFSS